jgi:MFS family permease
MGAGDRSGRAVSGKYQGLLGAVFGVTSAVGPLIGRLFVDYLSWRWVLCVDAARRRSGVGCGLKPRAGLSTVS